jgi:putative SOS response-associated peptidase YedK
MRWGFVSPTTKERKLAPINARAETLSTSPMFRDAFRRHRCLVVADGFYEWRKNDGRWVWSRQCAGGYNEVSFDPARPAAR